MPLRKLEVLTPESAHAYAFACAARARAAKTPEEFERHYQEGIRAMREFHRLRRELAEGIGVAKRVGL
ncbi:MAG TPA: hypothetical protein VEB18_03070 [Candidatus Paceibacterota bacterium]|nr:hypothetical protein [Candidatus Paceibacterota bacterium]